MASTNMASATSRFMLAAGMPSGVSGSNRVSFVSSNRLGRRIVVRAEEEPAEPPTPTPEAAETAEGAVATKAPAKVKPPPIGPKRGTKVRTLFR
jgi:photosystem I subunit 4